MTEQLATELTLAIAICSAIATACAVIATWRAPTAAAKLAEALRRDAERDYERQKQKVRIFSTLMQERARIYSEDSVRALNLIDVVFNESREVREAWSELFLAFHMTPLQQHVIDERLRRLLAAISTNIGLADGLRNDDLGRVYRPIIQEQEQFIKDIQRRQMLISFQASNAGGASTAQNGLWPPKPD